MDVKPLEFSHIVAVDADLVYPMIVWCTDNLGKEWDLVKNRQGRWFARINLSFYSSKGPMKPFYKFYFVDEQVSILFVLTWL